MAHKAAIIGRSILLLLLILIIAAAGLVWFDYLNLIDAKSLLAPIMPFLHKTPRTSQVVTGMSVNLNADRLALRLEALNLQQQDLATQQKALDTQKNKLDQEAQQLGQERSAFDEEQKSVKDAQAAAQSKEAAIRGFTEYLNAMTPAAAVAILEAMDDQSVIEVLKMADSIAQQGGAASQSSYWLQLMATPDANGKSQAERVATLQRKMAAQP
jgi:flagellar protein FlbB